jgi:hypothetical protein
VFCLVGKRLRKKELQAMEGRCRSTAVLTFSPELTLGESSYSPPAGNSEAIRFETGVSEALVREELDRVLASREFHSSKLCQNFLRYVVESALQGHPDNLKERTIGIEVFGKPVSYDPSEDAGVRVKAGEVRKRLRSYYLGNSSNTRVVIDLPSGTYVPEFHAAPPTRIPAALAAHSSRLPRYAIATVLTLLAVTIFTAYRIRQHRTADPLEQFWSPLFQEHKEVVVCTAPVPVYSDVRNPGTNAPAKIEDFVLIPNRFVAVSDVSAAIQIADMFARSGKPYKLRIGNDTSFRDLLDAPAVLVGFSYTNWHEIGEHFRYAIDLSQRPFGVWDKGARTKWTINTHPDDPQLADDYAIVSRVLYPGTNNFIVEITGISHYGTEAGTNLVTNPTILAEALRKMPAGWQQKNLQLVLHTEVVSGYPSVPTIVASHVW